MLSAFGSRITRTALPIIALSVLSVSPWEAARLAALTDAPCVLAIVLATPLAWYFRRLSFPLLCVRAALAGAASALFHNADVAILPRLVAKDHLVEANTRLQATGSRAELTGPGIAGVLIDFLTAPLVMVVDAFSFIWSAFWLWKCPKAAGEANEEPVADPTLRETMMQRMRDDVAVGFLAIWRCRPMRAIISATFLFYVFAGFFFATFTLFMLREVQMTPTLMGVIISVGGVSALLGSLAAQLLARRLGQGAGLVAGFVSASAGTMMLIPAAMLREWSVLFMVLQQLLGDAGMMIFPILAVSLQQRLLPGDQLARANGFNQVVNGVGMTVSILTAGSMAEMIGVSYTVIIGACICSLGVIPLLMRHLLSIREEPPLSEELAVAR